MNYEQTLHWLCETVPMFQQVGPKAYKNSLDGILQLCEILGNPQNKLKTIHVAGTNGKGSVSALLFSVLKAAGYKVGLYTSPHLLDFRERIRVNEMLISQKYVTEFIDEHIYLNPHKYSFFEITTAMAFSYFAEKRTEINIIETGLGGRLDCTNIVQPEVSVITNIGLDHTEILGKTEKQIAIEKAGIIKKNTPVVIGQYQPGVKDIFLDKARNEYAHIYFASLSAQSIAVAKQLKKFVGNKPYIEENLTTVTKIIEVLHQKSWNIFGHNIVDGIKAIGKKPILRGRWEIISRAPLTVVDVAHNPEGLKQVIEKTKSLKKSSLHIIFSTTKENDLPQIVSLFGTLPNAYFHITRPQNERCIPAETIADTFSAANLPHSIFLSPRKALENAQRTVSARTGAIVVVGSHFLASELLPS